jgi:hypothetical protein
VLRTPADAANKSSLEVGCREKQLDGKEYVYILLLSTVLAKKLSLCWKWPWPDISIENG